MYRPQIWNPEIKYYSKIFLSHCGLVWSEWCHLLIGGNTYYLCRTYITQSLSGFLDHFAFVTQCQSITLLGPKIFIPIQNIYLIESLNYIFIFRPYLSGLSSILFTYWWMQAPLTSKQTKCFCFVNCWMYVCFMCLSYDSYTNFFFI